MFMKQMRIKKIKITLSGVLSKYEKDIFFNCLMVDYQCSIPTKYENKRVCR